MKYMKNGKVFYRSVSKQHYDELVKANKMLSTGETTTSPNLVFSESYEGIIVQFKVQRGAIKKYWHRRKKSSRYIANTPIFEKRHLIVE